MTYFNDLIERDFFDIKTYPIYHGDDLGITYRSTKTIFKVWAPTASKVMLRIYDTGMKMVKELAMEIENSGVWRFHLNGNWDKYFYTYQANIKGIWLNEVVDPYAVGVSVNGQMGAILDIRNLPANNKVKEPSDAIIIYEANVRDISIDESAGINSKGKFSGLAEPNTTSTSGLPTGLSHLIELGITHLHLMPCYDYQSIDETAYDPEKYNWGYDPQNYNVPEGSYATNPYDPYVRNIEFKHLVNTLHENGIKVIMDVVYSHTYETVLSSFNQLVPGYFYRFKEDGSFSNGSGCDNEVASERPMVRKFINDSLKHWVKNYDVDGFRFDLMALYDLETINQVSKELRQLKTDILIYGEGWTGGNSPLPHCHRASKQNTIHTASYASFNDDYRDALKGKLFESEDKGFISGEGWLEETIKFGIIGASYHPQIDYNMVLHSNMPWARNPWQSINYISCHDNHTLFDKLTISNPDATADGLIAMHTLGLAMVLTSQGIPFLHSGSEFLRTKEGNHNSYNLPDNINKIDWNRKSKFQKVNKQVVDLILLRKKQSIFRLNDAHILQKHLHFLPFIEGNVVSYRLSHPFPKHDEWTEIIVAYNGSDHLVEIAIPPGKWQLGMKETRVIDKPISVAEDEKLSVSQFSVSILYKV